MTWRIRKKIAKRYLADGNVSKYILGQEDRYGNNECIETRVLFPWRIYREIRAEARRRGWDGCHWDDPTVIKIEDSRDGTIIYSRDRRLTAW